MWLFIILSVMTILLLGYAAILLLYRKWFLQLTPFVKPAAIKPATTFTIIIPARNEGLFIGDCLHSIVQQKYPSHLFEVIVIDDHSSDNTSAIVSQLSQQFNNIKLITLADELNGQILNSYKKKAIENAIGHATGEWIITTDADCIAPQNWLSNFDACIQLNNPVLVAAPVQYTEDGSLLQTFQALDFMVMQGVTFASVHAGFHNMCNGANLAYKKAVFFEVNGFRDIDDIASGDDMLLMNKFKKAYPNNISVLFSDESIVTTHPMSSWNSFFNQRIRWASKAEKFKSKDQKVFAVLVLVYCLNVILFIMPFVALLFPVYWLYWIVFLSIKTIIELAFALPVAKFFKQKFVWWFPLLQPVHIGYIVISGWLGKFGTYQWKGRNVQ
jgi:cellulose synthase/poly-beta-1,6-N-acetylglucosamine synthase-like glycosyltransferase